MIERLGKEKLHEQQRANDLLKQNRVLLQEKERAINSLSNADDIILWLRSKVIDGLTSKQIEIVQAMVNGNYIYSIYKGDAFFGQLRCANVKQ